VDEKLAGQKKQTPRKTRPPRGGQGGGAKGELAQLQKDAAASKTCENCGRMHAGECWYKPGSKKPWPTLRGSASESPERRKGPKEKKINLRKPGRNRLADHHGHAHDGSANGVRPLSQGEHTTGASAQPLAQGEQAQGEQDPKTPTWTAIPARYSATFRKAAVMTCLNPRGGTEAQEPAVCTARSRLYLELHAHACSLRCTLGAIRSGTRYAKWAGALARRHTDGPLWAALLKTTVMCEAWRRRTIAPPDPSRTADQPNPILLITGSSIPIPVPGQYRLSLCLK
jgi:hypothetical protein